MRHIIFLLDSTGQCCPRNLGTLIAVNRTSHSAVVLSLPCQRTKVQPQALEGSFWFPVISDSQTNNLSVSNALLPRVTTLCPSRQRTCHLFQEALLDHPLWLDRLPRLWPVFYQSVYSLVSCLESSSAGSVISTSQHLMQGLAWRRQPSVIVEYESCLTGGNHCCNASAHKFPITSPWVLTQS